MRLTVFAKIVLAICLLLLVTSAVAQGPVARVTDLTGVATMRHGDQWQLISHTPVDLFDGDKVNTDRGRATILFLGDESTLVLDIGTNVTIHQTTTPSGFARRVSIFLGDVWFKMTKTATQNTALVTPTAVGGLRGTEGNVHVESDSESSFTLNEGELAIQQREADGSLSQSAQPIRLRGGQTLGAVRGRPFLARPALARVERPDVKVAAEKLPQLRPDHQSRLRQSERPRGIPGAGPRGRAGMRGLRGSQLEPQRREQSGAGVGREPGATPDAAGQKLGDGSVRKDLRPETSTAGTKTGDTPAADSPRNTRAEAIATARAKREADAKARADAAAKARSDAEAAAKSKAEAGKAKKTPPAKRK